MEIAVSNSGSAQWKESGYTRIARERESVRARTDKAAFAREFLILSEAAQIDSAEWELFQAQFLNNSTRFGVDVKARQIAWSFTAALDAVVDGILQPGTPHIFVSINQDHVSNFI